MSDRVSCAIDLTAGYVSAFIANVVGFGRGSKGR